MNRHLVISLPLPVCKSYAVFGALRYEAARLAGKLTVEMTTGCMIPMMSVGDIGMIRQGPAPLGEGDIVALKRCQSCIVHRFLGRRGGGGFYHQGDMVIVPEVSHPEDAVVGRLVVIRRGSRLLHLDHPFIKVLSRLFVRITRLEAGFLEMFDLEKTRLAKLLMVWHRFWSTTLWSLCWFSLSRPERDRYTV